MSEHADELASRFGSVNDELVALLESCSADDWRARCADEKWPVCAVAHHVATANRVVASWIRRVAQGTSIAVTREMIDQGNDQNAEAHADCDQRETIDLLRQNGAGAMNTIRALSDEQLHTTAAMGPANERAMSAQQVIERVLIQHVEGHLASIRFRLAARQA
jgi:uncharacterized damage-inducible protein DinB